MDKENSFDSVLYGISARLRRTLIFLPQNIKESAEEIRLRSGQPVCITFRGRPLFILKNGGASSFVCADMLIATKEDLEESFLLLCRNSVFAHESELKNGYIMMKNGHRAGVGGTLNENGVISDISSINIRISHDIRGCAKTLALEYDGGGFLIAGPPGSGKTTMLRDLIRQLSSGFPFGVYRRISVIDSRGEISGSSMGEFSNNLGENTDILMIKNKAVGTEIALRTLFPDIIAFDEIGTISELKGVAGCFHSGVSVITTVHAGSKDDLCRRNIIRQLLQMNAISKIALLNGDFSAEPTIIEAKDLLCTFC